LPRKGIQGAREGGGLAIFLAPGTFGKNQNQKGEFYQILIAIITII
jgi:hypothetical protein